MKKGATASRLKVGIQGFPGAFHHIAAEAFYGEDEIDVITHHHFLPLAASLAKGGELDTGLMAIENSIAGSLLPNYQLLLNYKLQIQGEVYLRIKHNLMALPGQTISDIKEVYSHPMAIEQCRPFFIDHPHIRLVEAEDTALSALRIRDGEKSATGAIASRRASELYQLNMIEEGIESNAHNYTRFLIIGRDKHRAEEFIKPKVSVCFALGHEVGSLASILSLLADLGLNLIKIQSVPIHGSPWKYRFFVDFLLPAFGSLPLVVECMEKEVAAFHLLGVYETGQHLKE